MSITFCLVLLLLLSNLHAYNARTFGVAHIDSAKDFHYSISQENDHGTTLNRHESDGAGEERTENRFTRRAVPHKKRGEQEPGFNLDYLPPKTHPPVHN